EALRHLQAYDVDYLVVCPADSNIDQFAKRYGDIFGMRVAEGKIPAFLRPVPGTQDAAARIFTLAPQS
ncbi:hypothetical protein N9W17_04490, partial [Jannaschia sp.]|nr:hypothetical protein [Jannaschia sp.]